MMKVNFQVSQLTKIDPKVIIRRIQSELKDNNYDILEITEDSVKFYDDPWVLRWRHEQTKRLDGGIFKIDNATVTLNYYLNLWLPLIGVSIPVIGTLLAGAYGGTIFLTIFIIISSCVQVITLKNVSKEMLTVILNDDSSI